MAGGKGSTGHDYETGLEGRVPLDTTMGQGWREGFHWTRLWDRAGGKGSLRVNMAGQPSLCSAFAEAECFAPSGSDAWQGFGVRCRGRGRGRVLGY